RVDRRGLRARSVLHVVHRHRHDVDGSGQGRSDPHSIEGDPATLPNRVREPLAGGAEPPEQPPHEIGPAGVAKCPRPLRNADHAVPLEHAQPEVIEVEDLHGAGTVPWRGEIKGDRWGGPASSRTKVRSLPGARSKARSLRLESAGDSAIEILDRRDPGDGVEY